MNCADIKKMIPVYLDGALVEADAAQVKEHLSGCEACRKQAHALARAWKILGEYPDIEPDPAYVSRFWTELSRRRSWVERFKETVFRPKFGRPGLVTLGMIILVSVIVFRQYVLPISTVQQMAALNTVDQEIIENIELAEDLELIQDIEFWQDMDLIEQMDTVKGAVS